MRQQPKTLKWWLAALALGTAAVACSAIDDYDKTQNPRPTATGGMPGDAGVTGGTAATGP